MSGFGVRVKDAREGDGNHIIESMFELPLSHDLADEIMPAMARDLFQENGGEWVPKPEMREAAFNQQPATQILTVRQHPDLDPIFRAVGCSIRKIKAKKGDANAWILVFTVSWTLGADNEAITMIRALKSGVYITFEEQQPSVLDPGQAPENGATATVAGNGVVESIDEGKKKRKRRGKATPEAEAATQIEAGRAAAAGEDGDDQADEAVND